MKRIGLAQQVAEAQAAMHDQITEALRQFTMRTGLTVYRTQWLVAKALDERGNTAAVTYYQMLSDVHTS
jgi:hypothetical protein